MLTLPHVRTTRPWHQQRPLRKWVEDLFRLTSRKRSYTLLLQKGEGLAWVSPERRLVFITTDLPEVPPGVRADPLSGDARRAALLKALAVHEAGHVRHSGPKPSGERLGWLWNALEDERMERLMAREFPELASAFTLIGDVIAEEQRPTWEGSALEGCLFWRFTHDQAPGRQWQPKAEASELWRDVRPLVQAAWDAPHSEQVRWIAQVILDLVQGHPSDAPPQESQDGQEGAGGSGGDATPGEGDPADQARAGGSTGDQGQGEAKEPGAADPDANPCGAALPHGPEQTSDPSEQEGEDASAEGDGEDEADSVRRRYGPLVSASGAGSGEGDEDAEESGAGIGGARTDGTLPAPPTPDAEGGQWLAEGVEGHARRLAPLLRPPERPGRTLPHRSRGRYRYDRAVRGSERVFDQRAVPSRPAPIDLTLLVDVSGSMDGARLDAARQGALMLLRAAALCGSGVRVISFNGGCSEVVPAHLGFEEAAARLAGLTAFGGTRLAPALERALAAPPQPGTVSVVAVVCDGDLDPFDAQACRGLVAGARARGVRFVPLLIGEGTRALEGWRATFGSALPCLDVSTLARTLLAALTALRARSHES